MSKNNHSSNQVLRCIKDFKEVIGLALELSEDPELRTYAEQLLQELLNP